MQTQNILLALLLAASASASCLPVAAAVSSSAAISTPVLASAATTNVVATTANSTSFSTCSPAMDFQFGRAAFNRKATKGTFLPTDPVVAKGQQDALNPNIITNAIYNNLINSCGVKQGDAGETACLAAKAMVASLGTKDASTAAAWNAALGV